MRKRTDVRLVWVAGLLLGVLPCPDSAGAQEARLTVDNDLFGLRGTGAPPDHDYTSGLRLTFISRGELQLAIGQRLYTPRRDGPDPVSGERAYAGWLYGEAAWRRAPRGGRSLRMLSLSVGVVGPSALGEEVQNGIHEWTGSQRQKGWEHQLRLGPAAQLTYRDGVRLTLRGLERWRIEPYAEAFAGTVRTGLQLGLPVLFRSTPTLLPAAPGFGASLVPTVRFVAHDALLDRAAEGTTAVERRPWAIGGKLALGYRIGPWSLGYAFTVESREYATQPAPHRWGSITVAWSRSPRPSPRR